MPLWEKPLYTHSIMGSLHHYINSDCSSTHCFVSQSTQQPFN